ncbi:MAG TPA: hypothetical protein VJN93_17700 [Candidatus Acidoferrum sp.]|nr:hypothetical protein [Candidatus Acidoferrum sp.]
MSAMPEPIRDDSLTVCAISVLAGILTDVVHEGLGHGATALLSGASSGVLSTVAWSSSFDSRLVDAGGTLANLLCAIVFWLILRATKRTSAGWRLFLLLTMAFNVFTGTGYFLFSGFSNFGDWAQVIAGLPGHWLWRAILVIGGIVSYYAAALAVGVALMRYVGVPRADLRRLRKLTLIPYITSVALAVAGGMLNPMGIRLILVSALPATAGGHSAMLWLIYPIAASVSPARQPESIGRNYSWIASAAVFAALFIFVLGRGIVLHR